MTRKHDQLISAVRALLSTYSKVRRTRYTQHTNQTQCYSFVLIKSFKLKKSHAAFNEYHGSSKSLTNCQSGIQQLLIAHKKM